MQVPKLRPRSPEDHKGTFGRLFIIGGSRGMSGAVALAGSSATRSGAGLVTLGVPNACLQPVACLNPNYMTVSLAEFEGQITSEAWHEINSRLSTTTSAAIGPGLGQSPSLNELVNRIYERYDGPLVVDADGLNALAAYRESIGNHRGERVLTPHIGEFRRLIGESLSVAQCREIASKFAQENQVTLVLKGHNTIVTNGSASFINETGNPGMATGGSGDVLTGIITALCSQGYTTMEAAALGVHVHGLAGDIAAEKYGQISMVASDIRDCLPDAFRSLL